MADIKTVNPQLRGRIERRLIQNNNTVAQYLAQQHQRSALKRLPRFECEMRAEIKQLQSKNKRLITLVTISHLLTALAMMMLGGVLWL